MPAESWSSRKPVTRRRSAGLAGVRQRQSTRFIFISQSVQADVRRPRRGGQGTTRRARPSSRRLIVPSIRSALWVAAASFFGGAGNRRPTNAPGLDITIAPPPILNLLQSASTPTVLNPTGVCASSDELQIPRSSDEHGFGVTAICPPTIKALVDAPFFLPPFTHERFLYIGVRNKRRPSTVSIWASSSAPPCDGPRGSESGMDNNLHSLLGMLLPEDCRVTAVDGPMRSTPAKSKYGACFPPPAQPRATPNHTTCVRRGGEGSGGKTKSS